MNIAGGSIYSAVVSSHNDLTDIGVNNHPTIDNFINSKAQANGLAPLDSSSKVPLTHLPTSSNIFKGLWNANTNTPQLLTGGVGGITGDYYIVNIAGNTLIDGINTWDVGDWIIHTGTKWERIDNPDPELVDLGTEYKTLKDQPIKNNTAPTDPKHLTQKDYVDGQISSAVDHNNLLNKGTLLHVDLDAHVLDDTKHRLINDLGNSPTELFSSQKIINIQNSLQGQITTNDNDILALQNKTQKLNSSGDASAKINYASAQTFTNPLEIVSKDYVDGQLTSAVDHNNLLNKGTNTHAQIDAHISDDSKHRLINDLGNSPTELFSSQKIINIQNSLQGQITTNDNDILALQNKTQKLNSSGDASAKINYATAQTFTNPLEIVSKDYVDSKTSAIQGAVRYCGVYDATANSPDLITAGPYQEGCYHIVSVAGTPNLNGTGNIDLKVGDWVVRSPTKWEVIDNTDQSSSVATLELKAQYLDTNGRYTNDFLPNSNGAHPLGSDILKWSRAFVLDDVNCDRTILNKIWRTGGSQGVEFLSGAGVPVKLTGSDYSAGLDRGIITIDTSTVGEQGKLKKNSVASLSDAGDLKINGGELVKTTFTNDQELITKKYVDDANLGQGVDITTLQNKTQKLDTNGNFVATLIPNADNIYNCGANILRWNTVFGTNGSFSDKVNSNAFLNTGHNVGLNIANTVNGQVSFNSASLYADGNANRALIMDGTGNLNKSGVVINNQNVECKDILCQKIVGNTGGPNDLVLENQAGVGVIIKDGATGNLCLDGSAYTANVGKYLKIDDNKGLIVADTPAGGGSGDVIGPPASTDNAITRFDLATGKLIQNSTVLLTDTGAINNVLSIEPTANENVSYGLGANNAGSTNISLGTNSGTGNTGNFNVMIGRGTKNNSGGENIIIGDSAGSSALSGVQNICIGSGSGSNNLTSNNDCIFIGRGFNNIGTGGLNNMICLGNGITRRANEVVIGGTGSTTTTIRANADNHCDLGYYDGVLNSQFKNLYLSGSIFVNGVEMQLTPKVLSSPYLDTVSAANIQIACGLSKLLSAYTGNCLRVRRSNDNQELDIPFLANGFVDKNAISTFIGVNQGFLVIFYDQSGKGNNMVRPTVSEQPEILIGSNLDAVNDVRIKYDGINDYMNTLSDTNGMSILTTCTLAMRYSTTSSAPAQGMLNNNTSTEIDFSLRIENGTFFQGRHRNGLFQNGAFTSLADSKPHSFIMRVDTPTGPGVNTAYTNYQRADRVGQSGGSLFGTINANTSITPLAIGKSWDAVNGTTFFNGHINTFIVYDNFLSLAQTDTISQNIF